MSPVRSGSYYNVIEVLSDYIVTFFFSGLALIDFKENVDDPVGILQNWNINDLSPCSWRGIKCNNVTNRVETLYGKILTSKYESAAICHQYCQ